MFVSLTPISPTSDSIFLLSGVVDVVLFCTIRRVIPVKEVAKALFTGRIFHTKEDSSGDTTWCVGSLETGEKCTSDAPVDDDYFVLRQPKFEIVAPPPAVLPKKIVMPTTPRQIAQLSLTVSKEVAFHPGPQPPSLRTARSIPRKPLPREYSAHSEDVESHGHGHSSVSRQGSARRLPPIPGGPRTPTFPTVVEKWETSPPPCRPTTTVGRQSSASRSLPSQSRSGSLDSAVSDSSLISGSTVFGSTDNGSLKDHGGSSGQK